MNTSKNAKSVGSTFALVSAQAAKLGVQNGRTPVVGRLYFSPKRYGYAIRFQLVPTAQDLDYGCRFEPGE